MKRKELFAKLKLWVILNGSINEYGWLCKTCDQVHSFDADTNCEYRRYRKYKFGIEKGKIIQTGGYCMGFLDTEKTEK